jgi:signal peptidase I
MKYKNKLMTPKVKRVVREYVQSFVIAFILAMIIRTYVVQAFKIPTGSMIPTLKIGNRLLANKFIYRFKDPERGEVIIFKATIDKKKSFIKRLIGLPGETIEIKKGFVYVNGKRIEDERITNNYYYNQGIYGKLGEQIQVPEDSYFVLGDNSGNSRDSRYWGFVPKKNVKGRAFLIYWPFTTVKLIK